VVCLDSGAGNYDQLWLTTSLRGMASGVLKVEILTEGIHSGDASGLVPSSFRILRQVLDRLEDSKHRPPAARELPLRGAGLAPGAGARHRGHPEGRGLEALPLGLRRRRRPHAADHHRPGAGLLNRTWRPTLSVTGVEGFPALDNAGNVLRRYTAFKLSLRLPPLVDGERGHAEAEDAAGGQRALQRQGHLPPRRPRRRLGATGWNAPELAPWLEQTLNAASNAHFGAPLGYIGQGGTIPLMSMLQQGFPRRR
jgi:hypothetical protein